MLTVRYKSKAITDFAALVDQPFDLKSPSRSTVPLLAHWSDFDARLAAFGEALDRKMPIDATLTFEYTVRPRRGSGKASHTDLMITSPASVVAVEAKHTETKYGTVSEWLGTPPTENKKAVLQGWLDAINSATASMLSSAQVQDVTYQLIHRTASACTPPAETRAVVYHYFDPVDEYHDYYRKQLEGFAALIGNPRSLAFYLCESTLAKTRAYADLQVRWLANKRQDFSVQVRQLLKQLNVATFSSPIVSKFPT